MTGKIKAANPDLKSHWDAYGLGTTNFMLNSNYSTLGGGFGVGFNNIFSINKCKKALLSVGGGLECNAGYGLKIGEATEGTNHGTGMEHFYLNTGCVFPLGNKNNKYSAITLGVDAQCDIGGFADNEKEYTPFSVGAGTIFKCSYGWKKTGVYQNEYAFYVKNTTNFIMESEHFMDEPLSPGISSRTEVGFTGVKPGKPRMRNKKIKIPPDRTWGLGAFHECRKISGLPAENVAGITFRMGIQSSWEPTHVSTKKSKYKHDKEQKSTGIGLDHSTWPPKEMPTGEVKYEIGVRKDIVKDEKSGKYIALLEDGTNIAYKEQDPNKKARIYVGENGMIIFENMSDVEIYGNKHKLDRYKLTDCENVTIDVSDPKDKDATDLVIVRSTQQKSLEDMNIKILKDTEDRVDQYGTTDADNNENIIVVAKKEK